VACELRGPENVGKLNFEDEAQSMTAAVWRRTERSGTGHRGPLACVGPSRVPDTLRRPGKLVSRCREEVGRRIGPRFSG